MQCLTFTFFNAIAANHATRVIDGAGLAVDGAGFAVLLTETAVLAFAFVETHTE